VFLFFIQLIYSLTIFQYKSEITVIDQFPYLIHTRGIVSIRTAMVKPNTLRYMCIRMICRS